ncbi:Hypothetical protein CINCED_3A016350 [Cinara cedri]|uniref:Uncharacterized protein n=1 Tax=Cinara cedri TaxID=506608 RepID=A0A5E4NNI3_9HEMI|nr:Hypothetical protein CINCED_3A016350 [Cinara cedri]
MDLNRQRETYLIAKIEKNLNASTAEMFKLFAERNSNYFKTKEKITKPNHISNLSRFDSIAVQLISEMSSKFNLSNNDEITLKLCNDIKNVTNYIIHMDNIFIVDCAKKLDENNTEGVKISSCHLQNDYQTTTCTIVKLDDEIQLSTNDMQLSVFESKQLQAKRIKLDNQIKPPIFYQLKIKYSGCDKIENITVYIEDNIWHSCKIHNSLVKKFVNMDYREINEVQKIFPGYCWELFISLKIILGRGLVEKLGMINVNDLNRVFIPQMWLSDTIVPEYFQICLD